MAEKRSNEEIRLDVLKDDSARDVNFNAGVFIAVMATVSSGAAVLAVLCLGYLANFREDVANFWMCCLPLCFTFITGVALAYRKHLADVGVHIALAITTLLAGGAGYGLSITPVYLNRHNCTLPAENLGEGDCTKEVLTMVYFISGAIASGFGVLSFLASLCACSNAMGRRARREHHKRMRLEHEEQIKNREIKETKRRLGMPTLPQYQATYQAPVSMPVNGSAGSQHPSVNGSVVGKNSPANGSMVSPNPPASDSVVSENPHVNVSEDDIDPSANDNLKGQNTPVSGSAASEIPPVSCSVNTQNQTPSSSTVNQYLPVNCSVSSQTADGDEVDENPPADGSVDNQQAMTRSVATSTDSPPRSPPELKRQLTETHNPLQKVQNTLKEAECASSEPGTASLKILSEVGSQTKSEEVARVDPNDPKTVSKDTNQSTDHETAAKVMTHL